MEQKPTPSSTGVIRLETVEQFIEQSQQILETSLRYVEILTHDLDRPWLGNEAVIEALKQSILKNRHLTIQLLIADVRLAIKTDHPLIPLIRRLSRFEAREIDQELLEKMPIKQEMVLVDRSGIIVKQSQDHFIGFAHHNDAQSVKSQRDLFDQYWRFSHEHSDLRHMHL